MAKTTSATFIKNIIMAKKDFKKQQTAFKKAFIESIQSLIKLDKSVDYISWEQYTPSYNDGDAPQFYCRATSGYFNISYDGTLINHEDDNYERFSSKQIAKYKAFAENISKALSAMDEQHYQILFGDNVKITIDSKSISVDDYYNEY